MLQAFYSDHISIPLPASHRFPMAKYRRLRDRLTRIVPDNRIKIVPSPPASDEDLLLVHTQPYLEKLKTGMLTETEQRRIGFPWSPELVQRSRHSTGATIAAAHAALRNRIGLNLAGGTHHAFADRGQGFCVFNDAAVAARVLQARRLIERALIIDCDVHQGNGTADIFYDDPSVFTCSLHGARNYPFAKRSSDLDVAFCDGAGDPEYLSTLRDALQGSMPWNESDIVFYLAGADPAAADRLGRLNLTPTGLAARDRMVMEACLDRRLPLVIMMAGGYAANIEDTVGIHAMTVTLAIELAGCESE